MNKNFFVYSFLLVSVVLVFSFLKPSIVLGANSSLTFSPSNTAFEANANKTVDVVLDTAGEQIVGVDLIIDYDPNLLEVTAIGDLKIFSYKAKEIIDNPTGRIKVAFSNDYGKTFSGNAHVATIFYKFKNSPKSSDMHFFYAAGRTNDSNVVNTSGSDVLNSVGSLVINTSSNASSSTPAPTSGVLGESKKPTKKPEKEIKPLKNPGDSDFVFPDKIEPSPSVLGTDTSKDLQLDIQKDGYKYTLIILGIVLLLVVVSSVALIIYKKQNRN